jgi:hypothetical protein
MPHPTELKLPHNHTEAELAVAIRRRQKIDASDLIGFSVIRRAVDVRKRSAIALQTPRQEQDLEITDLPAASFWMSSSSEDMNLSLTLHHFDADGNEVMESGRQRTPTRAARNPYGEQRHLADRMSRH